MTLTELAVTIGIAGTLMAIAVPNYSEWQQRENLRSERKTLLCELRRAQTECLFRKRTATVTITPSALTVTTVPDFQASEPAYWNVNAANPSAPAPPPPAPGSPPSDQPETRVTPMKGLMSDYAVIQCDVRGVLFAVDADGTVTLEAKHIDGLLVGPITVREENQ